MKILFVSQSFFPSTGGVSYYLIWLAEKLRSEGHECIFINLRTSRNSDEEIRGFKVLRVPKDGTIDQETMKGYAKFKELLLKVFHSKDVPLDKLFNKHLYGFNEYLAVNRSFEKRIREACDRFHPDIIHIHDFQLLPQASFLKDLQIPLAFTWHIPFTEDVHEAWRKFIVEYLNQYSAIVFSTKSYVNAALKSGAIWSKVMCIPPFIDVEVSNASFRRKYGINGDEKLIICVARLDRLKGQNILIKAIKPLNQKFRLVLIGNGSFSKEILKMKEKEEYHRELVNMAASPEMKGRVMLTGSIEREMLMAAYKECDIVVLPSIQEGFGLAVMEGMAFKKPVIGSAVGGIPSQIWPSVNGFLVSPNDEKSLGEAVEYLLTHSDESKQMGESSRKLYLENFSAERGAADHVKLYDNMLKPSLETTLENNCGASLDIRIKIEEKDIGIVVMDYDRTIADENDGFRMNETLMKELDRLKNEGIITILATGRTLRDIPDRRVFDLFSKIIAENGCEIYDCQTKKIEPLVPVSWASFKNSVENAMRVEGIPFNSGNYVISINRNFADRVTKIIRTLGEQSEAIIEYNANDIMLLPPGINKGSAALPLISNCKGNSMGIGDNTNDLALFSVVDFKVAVGNAEDELKAKADYITSLPNGMGAVEVLTLLKKNMSLHGKNSS